MILSHGKSHIHDIGEIGWLNHVHLMFFFLCSWLLACSRWSIHGVLRSSTINSISN